MSKLKFIENEVYQRDWNTESYYTQEAIKNTIAASEILTKKEILQMIEDYADLYGLSLY